MAGVLVAMVLLVACSDGSPTLPGDPPASPSPSETAFSDQGVCPPSSDPALPANAGCVTRVEEGSEILQVYGLLDDESLPRRWRARLTSDQGEIDRPLNFGNDYPRAAGASDVDGDGRPEWWVKTANFASHGAPWSQLLLFFVRDGSLIPLRLEGEPLGINYGGISRLGEGARCRPGRLILLRAEAKNVRNTRWVTSERTFRIEGTKATLEGREEGVLRIDNYNDPDLDPYFMVDCYGTKLTPF